MIGNQERWQEDLFVAGPLRDLIPDDHVLKRVDKVLDLSWLRKEVADCYCVDNGRPGIDPEAAVRLMLAGLFQGIVHDRSQSGESVFVEQRPRQQSRPIVLRPGQGQAVVFPVHHRPRRGSRGDHRVQMRHGVSAVHTGDRHVLGVIFHNAR